MEEKSTNLDKSAVAYDKITNITQIASSIGFLAGLVYSFKKNKGFWGYVGYSLLGSVSFGIAANVTSKIIVK